MDELREQGRTAVVVSDLQDQIDGDRRYLKWFYPRIAAALVIIFLITATLLDRGALFMGSVLSIVVLRREVSRYRRIKNRIGDLEIRHGALVERESKRQEGW